MKRRLFTILSALSLLLCSLLVAGLFTGRDHNSILYLSAGSFGDRVRADFMAEDGVRIYARGDPKLDDRGWYLPGASLTRRRTWWYDEEAIMEWAVHLQVNLLIPLASVLPVAWLVHEVRRKHRCAKGLCPSCGYDLRASPERCPECGAVSREVTAVEGA